MYFSQHQSSRISLLMLCLAIAALSACKPSTQLPNANANTNASPATTTSSTSPTSTATTTLAKGAAAEQFGAIVGTQEDGWLPKVLAGKGLKKGLTPAETGKLIPGAEQVTDYGFSKVTVKDVPGLKRYEFYYAKGNTPQLESVRLTFDPMLNQAYPDLVKVLSSKYGAAKPEDVKKQIIVWVNPDFLTAQLTKQATDLGAYELNVSLEKN